MNGNRNLSVGLFVTVALIIFVGLMIWITGKKGNEPVASYSILIESDVSGLMLGGPVYYLGVQVGEVTDLTIVPGIPPSIRVDIQVQLAAPVDGSTRATLAAQGITGVSVINLFSDADEQKSIPRETSEPGNLAGGQSPIPTDQEQALRSKLAPFPIIPYEDSGFSAILSSAPAVLDKMELLLTNANMLFNQDNQAAITASLANIQSLTEAVAGQQETLTNLPGAISGTLAELRLVVNQVAHLVETAGPDAADAITNLEQAAEQLSSMTARLDGWLERHDRDIDAFANDGLGQMPALVESTRDTVRALEKLMEELRQQPSRALYKTESTAIEVQD